MTISTTYPHWPLIAERQSIVLGLERVVELLARLGNPHLSLPPVVHIAGTNGKGSTLAFLRAMCEAAGMRVHCYTSPHLVHFNERIVLAGKEINDDELYNVLEECRVAAGDLPVTFFEGTTAAAFLAFARTKADILLLETCLGGRLDATNVIPHPALTIITPIGLDHQDYWGETIAEIAREKAGIMKEGAACVIGKQTPETLELLLDIAAQKHVRISHYSSLRGGNASEAIQKNSPLFLAGLLRSARNEDSKHLPLLGAHQYENACVAGMAARELGLDENSIQKGLQNTKWPARLQLLSQGALAEIVPNHRFYLDGGHNPHAAQALAQQINAWKKEQPVALIIGMMADKDYAAFLDIVIEEGLSRMVAVAVENEPRSQNPEVLMHYAMQKNMQASVASSVEEALHLLNNTLTVPHIILICGSLYLAGRVLAKTI